jgi:Flp pilus assembly protein TadG
VQRRGQEAGQAVLLAAAGLTVFILAAGLAIDFGYLRYQKRLQQSAADSAAIAGASEINYGDVDTAAKTDSASNGFTDGSNNVTVTVYSPPNDGPHAGLSGYAEVLVTAVQPTFFMRIAGVTSETVTARAVAYLNNSKNCMYALGATLGITYNGTGGVSAPNCGIMDNENLLNNGTGNITATQIGVHGSVTDNGTGHINPTPTTGIVPATDPLSYLQPPTPGGCLPNGVGTANGTVPVILNPGNYCGGISINGTENVTLNAGMYTITGGGITFNGTGTVSGTDVTLYIGGSGGGVTLNGTQMVDLVAPTSGNYAGILFYQSPGNASAATINGTQNSKFEGALYFPSAQLTINGTGDKAAYTIAVAKSYRLNGTFVLNFPTNYSSLANGSPIKNAMLVE